MTSFGPRHPDSTAAPPGGGQATTRDLGTTGPSDGTGSPGGPRGTAKPGRSDGTGTAGRTSGTGAATLLRLALRRDRWRLVLWALGIAVFTAGSAASFTGLYPSAADRASRAVLMSNPTIMAFRGPGHGLDDYTIGAMVAHELLLWALLAAALMSLLLAIRHTRTEEETGRAELVRSQPVGPLAVTWAALGVVALANLGVAVALAASLAPIAELDPAGAVLFAGAVAVCGLVFGAVGLVTAQLAAAGRAAAALAVGVLGATFLLRAVGDMTDWPWAWLSPLGWSQATRVFVDDRAWPLVIGLVATLALVAVATLLARRRALGEGLLPATPGPARAGRHLLAPLWLTLRLHRTGVVGWLVGLVVLGAAFGAAIDGIDAFLADNPQFEQVLGDAAAGSLTDAFRATLALLLALLAAAYAVQLACAPFEEEQAGRSELLLAAGITRHRLVCGTWVLAGAVGTVLLLAGAAAFGTAGAASLGETAFLADVARTALQHLPGVWVLVAAAAAVYGLVPTGAAGVRILVAYVVVVGLMGEAVGMPDAARAVSPFAHLTEDAGGGAWTAPLLLTVVAALLTAVGVVAFRRRDLCTR